MPKNDHIDIMSTNIWAALERKSVSFEEAILRPSKKLNFCERDQELGSPFLIRD